MLKIECTGGFFANCSQKLNKIIDYINANGKYPKEIDTLLHFKKYNPDYEKKDVTYQYFSHFNDMNVELKHTKISQKIVKNIKYSKINYKLLKPVIRKFFTPSEQINNLKDELLENYNISFDTTKYCGVYYRGTDKYKETKLAPFNAYAKQIENIYSKNSDTVFIVQTDDTNFLNFINDFLTMKKYKSIIFKENITVDNKVGVHKTIGRESNFLQMKYCFAIFLILSECQMLICCSNQCSIWMNLYRRDPKNVYQWLNSGWL